VEAIPYCGPSPVPGALADRWNLDPIVFAALAALALSYALAHRASAHTRRERAAFATGLCVIGITVVSPLCALAVALFSARMAQHLLLVLIAAPLLVAGCLRGDLVSRRENKVAPLAATFVFAAFWWFWHAPGPYDAALRNDFLYASMQVTLLASAFGLWRVLTRPGLDAFLVGAATAMHMGLLGALLTFAPDPIHASHLTTTFGWGMSPLEDQQLAGVLCWVPGCGAFLIAGLVHGARWLGDGPCTKHLREVG
jgi:putative membrane protein